MGNRISWVDNAKAIGIMLVFVGHFIEKGVYVFHNDMLWHLYKAIYAFHMPFFFLLAGYFYRDYQGRFGSFVYLKIKTRLVPVVFFVLLSLLCWQWPDIWPVIESSKEQQMELIWLMLQGRPIASWPCWFFISLFIVEVVAAELIPVLRTKIRYGLTLPLVFWLALVVTKDMTLSANLLGIAESAWMFQQSFMALFFYLLGYGCRQYANQLMPNSVDGRSTLWVAVLGLAVLVLTYRFNFEGGRGSVNMSGGVYGDAGWFLLAAIPGIVFTVYLAACLPVNRCLDFLGKHTIPLVGINGWMISFLYPWFWSWLPVQWEGWPLFFVALALALLTLLLAMPIAWLMGRYMPWMVGQWK